MSDFPSFLSALRPEVDETLERLLPDAGTEPAELHEAMRYSVFAGGKRVRPALVVLAGEAWGGAREDLLVGGAALEMVHAFSLIHDDLPALDDDDLRRGRPTLHRARGEAMAVLAGDALLNRAYEVLGREPASAPPERRLEAVRVVADAVGTAGMIGGQVFDLRHEGDLDGRAEEGRQGAVASLERIHRLKTGALIEASTRLGGVYAGAGTEGIEQLGRIGAELGLLFQIGDDILDGPWSRSWSTAAREAAARSTAGRPRAVRQPGTGEAGRDGGLGPGRRGTPGQAGDGGAGRRRCRGARPR